MDPRRKLGVATTIAAMIALGVLLGTVATGGAAGTTGPSPTLEAHALKKLKQLRSDLEAADDSSESTVEKYHHLQDAIDKKLFFLGTGFAGTKLFGCDTAQVFSYLEEVDVGLETAAAMPKHRSDDGIFGNFDVHKSLGHAAFDAGKLTKDCRGSARATALFEQIQAQTDALAKRGKRPPKADRAAVRDLKTQVLQGEAIYGCATLDFFNLTDAIDTEIGIAAEAKLDPSLGREADREYRRLIDLARFKTNQLIEQWIKVPCDDGSTASTSTSTDTGPGTTTTSTTTTTTSTTAPTSPVCSDGLDNDADGAIDFPADSGCLSASDTTEQTTEWIFTFPGDGSSITNYIDFKPFFGPFGGSVVAYRVLVPPSTAVHDSPTPNHGATPINGAKPCGSLGATGIKSGIGSMAPIGGSLPPAPDSDHQRIVVDTVDPLGGGTCGTGSTTLAVATDTRLP